MSQPKYASLPDISHQWAWQQNVLWEENSGGYGMELMRKRKRWECEFWDE